MGYHVIIDPELFPVEYTYVERIEDLVVIEGINERSVIFQGHPENPPQQVGVSVDFQRLGEDWYRAGLRAQAMFARLARDRRLVLEELSQDPEHFKVYTKAVKGRVKRGDFLVRNRGNLEVEVKCRSFYGKGNEKYFLFSEDDLYKHLNMEKITKTPVVVAVFQRKEDNPLEDTLCMITVDHIQELTRSIGRVEKEYGWVYPIPVEETRPGFDLLLDYGFDDHGDVMDVVENGYIPYIEPEEEPYVLVAYYKNQKHLEWIVNNGLYNLRMGMDRGAIELGRKEVSARYILLHTKGEHHSGKLFRILDSGPRIYSREMLIRKEYPGIPGHDYYLVYRVVPVLEKELQEQLWDITRLSGYMAGHLSAFPFVVPLSELLKE